MKIHFRFWSLLLCGSALIFASTCSAQSAGASINSTGAAPDPSAMIDVSSTTKGALIPRMSTEERNAIVNPADGLQIYNTTTKCLNLYIGSTWKQVCGDCDFNSPVAGNNGPICEGSTLNLSATSIIGATYQWSGPNGFVSTLQNPSIPNATAGASGTYSLSATLNGCTSQLQNTVATVNSTPVTPVAGNNGPVCVGTTLSLSAATINGASYSWSGPNGYSAVVQDPEVSTNTQMSHAGVYNVVATVNGCSSASGSSTVVVNSLPATTFTPLSATTNVAKTFTPTVSGATYSWTFPSGSPSNSSAENPSVTWTSVGNYTVSLQVTLANGCTATGSAAVNVVDPVVVTFNNTSTGRYGTIQTYIVPQTGVYTIETWGAGGGTNTSNGSRIPGKGARMRGDFNLTVGQTLKILVGQKGGDAPGTAGSGGGTFVTLNDNTPLIVSGGGVGAHRDVTMSRQDAVTTTSGVNAVGNGGTGGGGGYASGTGGGGGAGLTGNPNGCGWSSCSIALALSFVNGGTGGGHASSGGDGGFGGGAGSHESSEGGGAGGYSGGGTGENPTPGGGGGSYNNGTNQSNTAGFNAGQGKVTLTYYP